MKNTDNNELLCGFGKWIREERERKELNQAEVGEMIGLHQTYYSRIESGKRVVDLDTAIRICKALKLDLSDFIKTYM